MESDPKHPSRWRRVILCRTVDKVTGGAKTFKESIIETCDKRNDDVARQVKLRVLGSVSDLHAADARYHKDCRDKFMATRSVTSAAKASGSQAKSGLEEAFLLTVSDIEADKSKIWNSVEVFDLYLSHGGEKCSRRSLVPKLCNYFGSDFLVLSGNGVANLLVFRSKASATLRLVQDDDDDIEVSLEAIGLRIVSETKQLIPDKNTYHAGIDLDLALECVSPTLLGLLAKLSKNLNHTARAALIGNIVTSVINNCYTDLQVSLGVVIGKKALIQDCFHFGVSCSYEEVLRFKDSAAAAAVRDSKLMGISAESDGLVQVVSDNFDANISSQNGLVSTHALAMLLTFSGDVRLSENKQIETFPRLKAVDMKEHLVEDTSVQRYNGPKKPAMPENESKRNVLPLRVLAQQIVTVSRAKCLDFAFLKKVTSNEDTPEFNGYNTAQAREQGHGVQPATRAVYCPLLDMKPSDPDTMLTAMVEAERLTNTCGQVITVFTNDQQLYRVAVDIKWVYQDRFLNLIPRLGGMHLLMSFIGCVGVLMANTGLDDILKSGFGGVQNMLSGKKFPQNFRALRLVMEELLSKVVENLDTYEDLVISLEVLSEQSKTTRVWVDCLIRPVLLMMLFVRAEREGDWPLHLWAVQEMMPYFFAAGHHHYARYGLYYLRSMERLPTEILEKFLKGEHVMRHKQGIWNGIWSDMYIETTFMRYGKGPKGIIGITLKPSTVKRWAFSMHVCCRVANDVATITQRQTKLELLSHKEENPARVKSDGKDRKNIRNKLEVSIDPLDPTDHPQEIVNIVSGRIAPSSVNVDKSVEIGKAQMVLFEENWPAGFNTPIPKQTVTMDVAKKSVRVGDKHVYDVNLIYSRVLGLQQTRSINLSDVLKHELAPVPTSMFKDDGEMRIATTKSEFKKKLQVGVSSRSVDKVDATVIDGCALLWSVHWPEKGTVKDYADNFFGYVMRKAAGSDVYLTFDRYYDYSIKSVTRGARGGKHATRRHHLNQSSALPPQKVVLTVNENKVQLIDIICDYLVEKCLASGEPVKHRIFVSGREPIPTELFCGHQFNRPDLRTTHEEADVTMVYQVLHIAQNQDGMQTIKVICDDTDVFVLLMHFCHHQQMRCSLIMEATCSERVSVDIQASVEKSKDIVPNLLAAHGLTGCDTVAKLHGIGKGTVINKLKQGHTFQHLGDLNSSLEDVMEEATKFIGACYGSKERDDMSQIRVDLWTKKMGKKNITAAPPLKTIPPTSDAFRENVLRAHVQIAVWKSAPQPDPPPFDPTDFGWFRDESTKTLTPKTLPPDVALAPREVLEMLRCGCSTEEPCGTQRCGCHTGHLPCTFFCACHGESHCQNPYNKEREADEGNEEFSSDEIENDLIME